MTKAMIIRPRLSEKAHGMSESGKGYVFEVPVRANKLQVASAISAQFGVTVDDVNIAVIKGKAKRSYRKGGRPLKGSDKDVKKAYVRLKSGDSINLFPAEEAKDSKKSKKSAKGDK